MKLLSITFCFLLSLSASAQIVGRVIDVQGNAFSFFNKKAETLKYGSKVYDLTEVMVEDGAALSVVNPDGHVFHINGGSLVKFYKGIVELKNGNVWVQSSNSKKGLVNSPNSIGQYGQGQFIYSFDNISGKTQLLVLTGDVKFSNALEPTLHTNIPAGYFTLVDQKYENGLPRTPTKVGLNSYKKMKQVFIGFKDLQDNKLENAIWGKHTPRVTSRGIASVTSNKTSRRPGKLIRITTYGISRVPASVTPMSYYTNLKKQNAWKNKPLKTDRVAPIRYFGAKWHKPMAAPMEKMANTITVKEHTGRVPASIQKSNMINDLKKSNFENSLNSESTKIKRHSNEVNNLIDELKTYKQDYKKNY